MLPIKQPPIQLIKQACLERYTTYEGTREAIRLQTGFQRKVPIPINPHLNIYLFPTHATNHIDCCWISYHHVLRIEKNQPIIFLQLFSLRMEKASILI
ncbi:competence protein ComK [Oceanobacillus salinisoli]|uniref:competence protein ComK n=1 Tax=Oceanobacillus salinisoli TaxID=2678611 RepID=UPI0038B244DA